MHLWRSSNYTIVAIHADSNVHGVAEVWRKMQADQKDHIYIGAGKSESGKYVVWRASTIFIVENVCHGGKRRDSCSHPQVLPTPLSHWIQLLTIVQ